MSIAPGGMGASTVNADAAQLRRELGAKEQRCTDLEKVNDKLQRGSEALKTEVATLKEEASAAKKEVKKSAAKAAALERGKDELEKVRARLPCLRSSSANACWAGTHRQERS